MNKIETHINRLFSDIPDSGCKKELVQEVKQNLNDKVADLISQGMTENEAVQKAIDDFGDVDEIRKELMGEAEILRNRRLGQSLAFSVWGSILITALFLFINFYYSPQNIWFVYPVFCVVWWPMSLFFHWLKRVKGRRIAFPYSVWGFVLLTALFLFINFYYSPGNIWFVYPVFGIAWWPVSVFFVERRRKEKEEDPDE